MLFWKPWRQRLHSLSIGRKIALGYGVALGLGLAGTLTGLVIADYYQGRGVQQLTEANTQVRLLNRFNHQFKRIQIAGMTLPALLDHPNPRVSDRAVRDHEDQIRQGILNLQTQRRELQAFIDSDPAWLAVEAAVLLDLVDRSLARVTIYAQRIDAAIPSTLTADWNRNGARRYLQTLNRTEALEALGTLEVQLDQVVARAQQQVLQAEAELEKAQGIEKTLIVVSSLLAVAIAGFVALRVTQSIGRPLSYITRVARTTARHGNFDQRLSLAELQAHEEISSLGLSINYLIERVRERSTELRQAKDAAEAASQAKGSFLAKMSHELRTPLNAILGFAQLMERDLALNPQQALAGHREHIEIINRSGEHLLQLINDVLDVAKIESGAIALKEKDFDSHELLESLRGMLYYKAQAKGLDLHFDLDAELPRYLRTDVKKLRQVLINLLNNAIKFTDQGEVRLQVRADRERSSQDCSYLHFSVRDTGPGIAPTDLERIFDAFKQTETGQQASEGTGLGLTISRQFVQLLGGELRVESVLGKGACFQFVIPVYTAQAEALSPVNRPRVIGLAPGQPRYRLLVVEDRWENRQLLLELLKPLGLEVKAVNDGQAGVEAWQQWRPDLIWMDMQMPVLDGFGATRAIRAQEATQGSSERTPIIALTASVFERDRQAVITAGCDDFVTKPFQEQTIFDRLAQFLGVQYRYDQDESAATAAATEPLAAVDLLSLLAAQPLAWCHQLEEASLAASARDIEALLAQLPSQAAPLAAAIAAWVNEFRYDKITEALTQRSQQSVKLEYPNSLPTA